MKVTQTRLAFVEVGTATCPNTIGDLGTLEQEVPIETRMSSAVNLARRRAVFWKRLGVSVGGCMCGLTIIEPTNRSPFKPGCFPFQRLHTRLVIRRRRRTSTPRKIRAPVLDLQVPMASCSPRFRLRWLRQLQSAKALRRGGAFQAAAQGLASDAGALQQQMTVVRSSGRWANFSRLTAASSGV